MDKSHHPFKVIDGGGEKPTSNWLSPPKKIIARSASDISNKAFYRVSRDYMRINLQGNRRQPIFDFWSCIYGKVPPVANVSAFSDEFANKPLSSLGDAHACFRGLKRPVGEDDTGWDHAAFISKPKWFFRSQVGIVTAVRIAPVPEDLVFVTYVRLNRTRPESDTAYAMGVPDLGVITHWEFVEADQGNPMLPVEYASRYRRRSW